MGVIAYVQAEKNPVEMDAIFHALMGKQETHQAVVVIAHKAKNHAFLTTIATIRAKKVKFTLDPTAIVFVYLGIRAQQDKQEIRLLVPANALIKVDAQQDKQEIHRLVCANALIKVDAQQDKQEIRPLVRANATIMVTNCVTEHAMDHVQKEKQEILLLVPANALL